MGGLRKFIINEVSLETVMNTAGTVSQMFVTFFFVFRER